MENKKFIQEKNIDSPGPFFILLLVHRTVRTHGQYATYYKFKKLHIYVLFHLQSLPINNGLYQL